MLNNDGAANVTGMPLRAPQMYLAYLAALSDVPLAAMNTPFGTPIDFVILLIFDSCEERSLERTEGCARISERSDMIITLLQSWRRANVIFHQYVRNHDLSDQYS